MTKLKYSENGLNSSLNTSFLSSSKALKKAVNSSCEMIIPNDFAYLNYLCKLPSIINSYDIKNNSIQSMCKTIDSSYDDIENTMTEYNNSVDDSIIEKRERLIK